MLQWQSIADTAAIHEILHPEIRAPRGVLDISQSDSIFKDIHFFPVSLKKRHNDVFQRFLEKKQYFTSLRREDGERLISDEIIALNEKFVKKLSDYFPVATDREIFFEPDDDGTILIFIEIENIHIMVNIFQSSIQYNIEDKNVPDSFYVSEIPLREYNRLLEEILDWTNKNEPAQELRLGMRVKSPAILRKTISTKTRMDHSEYSQEDLGEVTIDPMDQSLWIPAS